jgi:hypothetical protein
MNRLLRVAVLVISTVPLYAQGQQLDIAKLKADARKVVGIIGADRAKIQTYCQFANLSDQLDQANQDKDSKNAVVLSQKIDGLKKKLGPEFVTLVDGLKNVDPDSPDGQEIASIIESLDDSCED